jgi:predicted ATPase
VPATGGELWHRLPTPVLPLGHAGCDGRGRDPDQPLRLIVLTGGPGAGKTAVLAAARAMYCRHVAVVPEAATILFTGGFPRHDSIAGRQAAQRAIFHVQREAERLVDDELEAHTALCDRGTVDGEAYWPDGADAYWRAVDTTRAQQLERYARVIHLRTPPDPAAYDHSNIARIEQLAEARRIDDRIFAAWDGHPDRIVIEPTTTFEDKLHAALAAIERALA